MEEKSLHRDSYYDSCCRHENDNAFRAETGDTTQRAIDKDAVDDHPHRHIYGNVVDDEATRSQPQKHEKTNKPIDTNSDNEHCVTVTAPSSPTTHVGLNIGVAVLDLVAVDEVRSSTPGLDGSSVVAVPQQLQQEPSHTELVPVDVPERGESGDLPLNSRVSSATDEDDHGENEKRGSLLGLGPHLLLGDEEHENTTSSSAIVTNSNGVDVDTELLECRESCQQTVLAAGIIIVKHCLSSPDNNSDRATSIVLQQELQCPGRNSVVLVDNNSKRETICFGENRGDSVVGDEKTVTFSVDDSETVQSAENSANSDSSRIMGMGAADVTGSEPKNLEDPAQGNNDFVLLPLNKSEHCAFEDVVSSDETRPTGVDNIVGHPDIDSDTKNPESQLHQITPTITKPTNNDGSSLKEQSCELDACLRLDRPQSDPSATATKTTLLAASIENDVAQCARASGCSRVPTADDEVCVAATAPHPPNKQNSSDNAVVNGSAPNSPLKLYPRAPGTPPSQEKQPPADSVPNSSPHLSWKFKNGRLVFESENAVVPRTQQSAAAATEQVVGVGTEQQSSAKTEVNVKDDQLEDSSLDSNDSGRVLSSKDLNRRIDESRSRLRYLEEKLKQAGITDDDNNSSSPNSVKCNNNNNHNDLKGEETAVEQVVDKLLDSSKTPDSNKEASLDDNQNIVNCRSTSGSVDVVDFCQFDASQITSFSGLSGSYIQVYDELEDDYSSDDSDLEFVIKKKSPSTMRGDSNNMSIGMENESSARPKHNPDRDNLKSLLKRPGGKSKQETSKRGNNRVVFNETKNEFFDADYIILIREECDYDDEDDDGVCTCNNQHEMVRLTCCEPNCNCGAATGGGGAYDSGGYDQQPTPQSPKFAPPLEFVDAVTLSPPEGYKDMELGEQQLLALQQMARARGQQQQQRTAVCKECSVTHEDDEDDEGAAVFEERRWIGVKKDGAKLSAPHSFNPTAFSNGDGSQSDNEGCTAENGSDHEEQEEKEKTDQSQQTTPTTPPNDSDSPNSQRYILETITMTTVTEQRILREVEEEQQRSKSPRAVPPTTANNHSSTLPPLPTSGGSPINGILKGGRLWKQQQSLDGSNSMSSSRLPPEPQQATDSSTASDDEGSNRRSVRFIEAEQDKRDSSCDGASDNASQDNDDEKMVQEEEGEEVKTTKMTNSSSKHQQHTQETTSSSLDSSSCNNSISASPESTEMMLTFKLGNHVLISNNSLKPNSAVRQLFPCTKPLTGKEEEIHKYLVTAESLRAFEEAKRSKLPQIIQSGETDESIKRAIERNTLRRSLIRYEPRSKKNLQKTDNSLVERIKQLTCDVDDVSNSDDIPLRASPPGEEARNSPETNSLARVLNNSDKSFSPSSSSTTSSNSSSMSSTYKKITDLFGKRTMTNEKLPADSQNNMVPHSTNGDQQKLSPSLLPDLGNGGSHAQELAEAVNHCPVARLNSTSNSNENRKQFLSTLAPLTACVSGLGNTDEYYYHMNNHVGERASMASSVGTEYSLEDIDEGLRNGGDEETKKIAPDVLAGTPSASESGDELAMFVQQDASRIERIKKKYQPEQQSNKDEDDEHDDYGFNRRPSVRGIKPRFGSTTEILQQIQNQIQAPPPTATRVAWPYYSESGLTTAVDNHKPRNLNQNMPNYQYPNVPEEMKSRNPPQHYRPTSLHDENMYQNCTNQRCVREMYKTNVNQTYSSVMKVGTCNEYYQSLPRARNGRPQSPPPLELSKNFHQTMVYIPYNHIEGYQPTPYYHSSDYVRVSNQNQINKRYIEPMYQQRIHPVHLEEHHYPPNVMPSPMPKQMIRTPYSQPHLVTSRSESPLPGQFSTARSTQTPAPTVSTCNYYASNPRYRPMIGPVWPPEGNYVSKMSRHSFPAGTPRYPGVAPADNISLTDSDSQHSGQMPNGYRQPESGLYVQRDSMPNSPTKPRFIERGVPEGAASAPQQDSSASTQSSSSTMTSPTSPQNPGHVNSNQKPLFYAMNV